MSGDPQTFELKVKGTGDPAQAMGSKSDLPPDPESDLQGAIATDPEVRFVRVHRRKLDGSQPFLATIPADGFSLEAVRDMWGGGAYQVFLLNDRKRIRSQTRVDIDGAPKGDGGMGAPIAAAAPAGESEVARGLRELRELVMQMKNAPPAAAAVNPIDSAVAMVTAIQSATAPLLEAVLKTKQQDPGEIMLRTLRLGFHLAQKNGGGEGKRDPIDRLIDDFAMPLISRINSAGVPTEQPQPAPAPEPQPQPAQLPEGPPWVGIIGPFIPRLCMLASFGKNPAVWAGVIADEADDAQAEQLKQLLAGEGFAEQFFTTFPATLQHREWFNELLTELGEALKDEEAPPPKTSKKKPRA